MNEAETRAEHIDPALKAAGLGVAEGSRVRPVSPPATRLSNVSQKQENCDTFC